MVGILRAMVHLLAPLPGYLSALRATGLSVQQPGTAVCARTGKPVETAEILARSGEMPQACPGDRYVFRYVQVVKNCQMPPARPVEFHASGSEPIAFTGVA